MALVSLRPISANDQERTFGLKAEGLFQTSCSWSSLLWQGYPLSYRHLEEMMQERGVFVDHSSINRWAIRFLPSLEKMFRKYKHPVGDSWRMDETYIKVKGLSSGSISTAQWTMKARQSTSCC